MNILTHFPTTHFDLSYYHILPPTQGHNPTSETPCSPTTPTKNITKMTFQFLLLLLLPLIKPTTAIMPPGYPQENVEHTISSHYRELNPNFGKGTFDWDNPDDLASTTSDQQIYDAPPYGKSWGQARSYGGKTTQEPLYYDPEDPYDGAFNASLKHYTFSHGKWVPKPENQFQGAAYLPSGRSKHPDPLHPQFGFVPVNYVNPNWEPKPFHINGPPIDMRQPHTSLIPSQIPFPITLGGNHPLYSKKYYPGVQPGRTKLSYPTPIRGKYKFHAPAWFDGPNSWPHPDPERVPTIPFVPPPPPPKSGSEGGTRRRLRFRRR